jgi:hypothetical protein
MRGPKTLRRGLRRLPAILASVGLVAGLLAASTGIASASDGAYICSGTLTPFNPGVLSGTHGDVRVVGACAVNGGPALVRGDLIVTPGSTLVAAFAFNDVSGIGVSNLTVRGNVRVGKGATAIIGCHPVSFSCIDDPNNGSTGVGSHDRIGGDLTSSQPLGVIVHNTDVGGDILESGGGGGQSCGIPVGTVFEVFQSPAFSAYEDGSVKGDVSITGMTTCWVGLNRLTVRGDMRLINNQLADPDGIEILANRISGDLVCRKNSMVWDNAETGFPGLFPRTPPQTNTVKGDRVGQCVLSSPVNQGDPLGPGPF